MRIVCISDIHNKIGQIKLPPGDLLVIAGDLTGMGTIVEISKFNNDLEYIKLLYKHGILVIFGNHDILAEDNMSLAREMLTNAKYVLQDQSVEIDGIKFYGTAWTPRFHDWAFNVDRGAKIKEKWNMIPTDTDILVTHGPPHMILDVSSMYENIGCQDLLDTILVNSNIKAHIFGHNHFGYGIKEFHNKLFINASSLNEKYQAVNKPIMFDFDPTTKKYEIIII